MAGVASAATSIVIAHIAGGTKTIRVGAGGTMLPSHAPYIIASSSAHWGDSIPDALIYGLGRAPGIDRIAVRAVRRSPGASDHFQQDVLELQAFAAAQSFPPGSQVVSS